MLGNVKIIQIDAQDNSLEEWTLHGAFIKKITYGELDYENDDLTQMEVEFRYDYAVCKVIGVDKSAFDSNNTAPPPIT
jgi:sucrose-6-phosphate hydrolase SacC (GH32 family)